LQSQTDQINIWTFALKSDLKFWLIKFIESCFLFVL